MTGFLTPSKLGYRMPPEWHRHAATWLVWPKDPMTWPNRVPLVEEIFLEMMAALVPHEQVCLIIDDESTEDSVRTRCQFAHAGNIIFHKVPTVDSWIRDYGPNFLIRHDGTTAFNDWRFNAWGDKYEELKRDDSIPARLEEFLKMTRFEPGIVLEGGSIDVNGAGVVMTTEQCLLNPNRNPDLDREAIEQILNDYLGTEEVLWLGTGIVGDDTDGHIDDLARFISGTTIVCAIEDDPSDANYEILQDNYRRLKTAKNAIGESYEIITMPMPGFVGGIEDRLPASYLNFYIANNVVLMPAYGHQNDEKAAATLGRLMPKRRVIPMKSEPLVWGMGAVHCLTQQQPAAIAL